jgi:hypothetical protein
MSLTGIGRLGSIVYRFVDLTILGLHDCDITTNIPTEDKPGEYDGWRKRFLGTVIKAFRRTSFSKLNFKGEKQ